MLFRAQLWQKETVSAATIFCLSLSPVGAVAPAFLLVPAAVTHPWTGQQ